MLSPLPDRDQLVGNARRCHIQAAFSAIHYGGAHDSSYSGNHDAGRYFSHDGCGNVIHLAWHRRGAVALVFDHESDRSEFNRPVTRRRPCRWLPGEPVRALFEAARADHADDVRSLAAAGADLDARTVEDQWPHTPAGDTPLIQALKAGATTAARVLVELGADPAAANAFGRTALHCAVDLQDSALVEYLIRVGAPVNTADHHYRWTPLHQAALRGDAETVELLLTAGADRRAVLIDGRTPADCARTGRHAAVAARLARTGGVTGAA